VNFILIKISVL